MPIFEPPSSVRQRVIRSNNTFVLSSVLAKINVSEIFQGPADRSMYTCALCRHRDRFACHGNDRCAMMIGRSGKSTATSSVGIRWPYLGRSRRRPACLCQSLRPIWDDGQTPRQCFVERCANGRSGRTAAAAAASARMAPGHEPLRPNGVAPRLIGLANGIAMSAFFAANRRRRRWTPAASR